MPRRAANASDRVAGSPPAKRRRFPALCSPDPLPGSSGEERSDPATTATATATASPATPRPGAGPRLATPAAAAETAGGRAQRFQDVTGLEAHRVAGMPGAAVYYVPGFVGAETASGWYSSLVALDAWYQPTLKLYGRAFKQSRQIAAYGEPGLRLRYSGQEVDMRTAWPGVLQDIRQRVEGMLGVEFNHVMLNSYADGSIYIGKHRDNFENRVIASVSVGAERTFVMSYAPLRKGARKLEGEGREEEQGGGRVAQQRWVLGHGSLVVMQGDTQRFWKHEIPKEPKVKGGRISLTFRQLVS